MNRTGCPNVSLRKEIKGGQVHPAFDCGIGGDHNRDPDQGHESHGPNFRTVVATSSIILPWHYATLQQRAHLVVSSLNLQGHLGRHGALVGRLGTTCGRLSALVSGNGALPCKEKADAAHRYRDNRHHQRRDAQG
jgi:hypothetical protein